MTRDALTRCLPVGLRGHALKHRHTSQASRLAFGRAPSVTSSLFPGGSRMAPASKARPFRDKTPALAGATYSRGSRRRLVESPARATQAGTATSVTSGIANADRHDGTPAGLLACLLSLETKRSASQRQAQRHQRHRPGVGGVGVH